MDNFISFEGCEGVGKTTQVRLLREYCENNKLDVVFTREPGGSGIAEKIRNIILDSANRGMTPHCEALLYAAARNQHLHDIILPNLRDGKKVVCDRYCDSTYAYQGFARGLGVPFVDALNNISIADYKPVYTVFLSLEPSKSFLRKAASAEKDRLEMENIEFHNKVYQGYLGLIRLEPTRFIVIDASGSKKETHEKVLSALIKKGFLK